MKVLLNKFIIPYKLPNITAAIVLLICMSIFLVKYFPVPYPEQKDIMNINNDLKKRVEKIFEYRMNIYKEDLGNLYINMKLQGILIFISIMIMVSRTENMNVPIINTNIPVQWLRFLVPFFLLYLWVQFVFILDKLIENRIVSWGIIDSLEEIKYKSVRSLFNDHGFMDGWFSVFIKKYADINPEYNVSIYLFSILYGVFFGCTNAFILSTLFLGIQDARNRLVKKCFVISYIVCFFFLVLAHWLFAYKGGNPNILQFFIAFFALLIIYIVTFYNRKPRFHHSTIYY